MSSPEKSAKEQLQANRPDGQKYCVISCEIFYREICHAISRSDNIIDLQFLPKGLHDLASEEMLSKVQSAVDAVCSKKYDAVLLAYGRCNNGVVGLTTSTLPLVVPRVHDCIGLLMGSHGEYQCYFNDHPGTFFRSSGWRERDTSDVENSVMSQLGLNMTKADFIAKYGEADAEYIMKELGCWTDKYTSIAYIDMGLTIDEKYAELTRQEAEEKGLEFKLLKGNISLLQNLVDGKWEEENFLVVQPGHTISADDSGNILTT